MLDLVHGVLGLPRTSQVSNSLHKGFSYIYTLQPNVHLGNDGYDNEQAPVEDGYVSMFKRRMWVKGELTMHQQLPDPSANFDLLETVTGVRKVHDLALVTISKSIQQNGQPILSESRSLMYTNQPYKLTSRDTIYSKSEWGLKQGVCISRMDLLKYSMLTKNTHKIHIDPIYAREEEGLPEVVVHGPFMVTLVLYWLHSHGIVPVRFKYRNLLPCFAEEKVVLAARETEKGYSVVLDNEVLGKRYFACEVTI